ncbi:flagellar biosynthesis protein FliQ [Carboxydochorda subterranea]|uniref:Flagellar biosynthetic protein FliQ n=1 Tax=Carboxydichorda subterranea TaxID=3109565 RepID=A0ABZ1C019_9FIRM|nr:flagellar biosynthesis protein FliQ [Limnochorda sp. L945t]WRP18460.1 flagellar biosynthesis protein FliQ [Limnochorda sp. L945t]
MSEATVLTLGRDAIVTVLLVSGPLVGLGLVVGVVVSILMATTQIQEQTLAFVPKILATLLGMLVFGAWMMRTLLDFTNRILGNLTSFIS